MRDFRDLEVYRLAERLSGLAWDAVRPWEDLARRTVGIQLVRSADSIGANLAEGTGRGSYNDNRRFVSMARGSLYETRHWLRLARRRGLLDEAATRQIAEVVRELGPRLNRYLQSIGRSAPLAVSDTAPPPAVPTIDK